MFRMSDSVDGCKYCQMRGVRNHDSKGRCGLRSALLCAAASNWGIQNRIKKERPPPFGMLQKGCPPMPQYVEDPEKVSKQE